jgi:predicted peroxiredoxin
MKKLLILVFISIFTFLNADSQPAQKLLVNITSDGKYISPMAVAFAVRSRLNGFDTSILLNVEGVKLAIKDVKTTTCPDGKNVQDKLKKFMKLGGEIFVCPMCLKMQNYTKEQLIDGVKLGGEKIIMPLLKESDKVISY